MTSQAWRCPMASCPSTARGSGSRNCVWGRVSGRVRCRWRIAVQARTWAAGVWRSAAEGQDLLTFSCTWPARRQQCKRHSYLAHYRSCYACGVCSRCPLAPGRDGLGTCRHDPCVGDGDAPHHTAHARVRLQTRCTPCPGTMARPRRPGAGRSPFRVRRDQRLALFLPWKPAGSEAQAAHGVLLDHSQRHLVTKKVADVWDAVEDHGGPLQREAPCDDVDVFRQAHRPQHLRPEHARVTHLYPLAQLLRVPA